MTATSAPFGLDPVFHPSGQIHNLALYSGIASGYAADIYYKAPVKFDTNGNLVNIASTSDALAGVFAGCQYTPPGGLRPNWSNFWPANATYIAGTMIAYYWCNPDIVYAIQANGSVAQSAIYDQTNLVNYTAGQSAFGTSTASASASLVGAGNQGQLRIIGKGMGVDNAWGDAYTTLRVQIARGQTFYPQVAI